MATRYIKAAGNDGWLNVRWVHDNSTYPPLPQYLEVDQTGSAGGRDQFTVKEGKMNGKAASVTQSGGPYLTTSATRTRAAKCKFDIGAGKFYFGNSTAIAATTQASNPPPIGTHDLEIPYEVHGIGRGYAPQSRYATTWFRIGHSGDRFLHAGRVSAGCITITDIRAWTRIYEYLITARKDSISVGQVEIVR